MTPQNITCPKCNACYDEISNVQEMQQIFGINETDCEWMCNKCSYFFDQETEKENYDEMSLESLAFEILKDWEDIPKSAFQYVNAMTQIQNIDDEYGLDDGRKIVAYFLTSARTWKGDVARKIKKELKDRLNS